MATNGDQSYAVFTYKCGELNWLRARDSNAVIGFSAGPNLYANHPLSRQPNVNTHTQTDRSTAIPAGVVAEVAVAAVVAAVTTRSDWREPPAQ